MQCRYSIFLGFYTSAIAPLSQEVFILVKNLENSYMERYFRYIAELKNKVKYLMRRDSICYKLFQLGLEWLSFLILLQM